MLLFLLFMWRIKRHICLWYCCPRSKARKWRLSDCERIKKALAHLKSPLAFRWFLYNTDLQLNSVMVMRSHTYTHKSMYQWTSTSTSQVLFSLHLSVLYVSLPSAWKERYCSPCHCLSPSPLTSILISTATIEKHQEGGHKIEKS